MYIYTQIYNICTQLYMAIRDYPHVVVGGSMTEDKWWEKACLSPGSGTQGMAGRLQSTPSSSENSPYSCGVSLVYLKDSVAVWEQKQACFYYAVCSASWSMCDSDREIWGCLVHIVIEHLKENMVIIKNICKTLLCITCETDSDALTCWNYQRQCHQ